MSKTLEGIPDNWKWIALILNGEVVSKMAWDPRLASILLSSPQAMDITEIWDQVHEGFKFDGSQFIPTGEEVDW